MDKGQLTVIIDLDPWMLTAGTARDHLLLTARFNFFGKVFRAPSIEEACLDGTGTLRDIRGNKSRGDLARICMTRKNATTVKWAKVSTDDLGTIADEYWLHPGMVPIAKDE